MRSKYLDVLKAFAIIAVVFYHSGFFTNGYLGVDLFLVVTGYLTTRGLVVREVEIRALAFGHALEDVIVVGEKDFGETMTQIYIHRFKEDYFNSYIQMKPSFAIRNNYFKKLYGGRFIDLYSIIKNDEGDVRAFTDDNKFISSDCHHLTRSGASFFAKYIDFENYLK